MKEQQLAEATQRVLQAACTVRTRKCSTLQRYNVHSACASACRAAEEAALAKRIKVSLQKKLEAAESYAVELHDKLQHLMLQHQKEQERFCKRAK